MCSCGFLCVLILKEYVPEEAMKQNFDSVSLLLLVSAWQKSAMLGFVEIKVREVQAVESALVSIQESKVERNEN